MAAPMQQFAGLLQAVPRSFAYGLQALIEEKGGAPEAPADTDTDTPAEPGTEATAEPGTDTTANRRDLETDSWPPGSPRPIAGMTVLDSVTPQDSTRFRRHRRGAVPSPAPPPRREPGRGGEDEFDVVPSPRERSQRQQGCARSVPGLKEAKTWSTTPPARAREGTKDEAEKAKAQPESAGSTRAQLATPRTEPYVERPRPLAVSVRRPGGRS